MSQAEATDLVCRAHSSQLDADEQRRLAQQLASSFEARLMDNLLSSFEREARVQPGDELLLARMTARALKGRSGVVRRPRTWIASALAAALLLMASLSAAWMLQRARSERVPPTPPSAPSGDVERPKSRSIAPARPEPRPEPQLEPQLEPLEPAPQPEARKPRSVERTAASAASVFARANDLRRSRQTADAIALYRELLNRYPNSREAAPARLALAKLLASEPHRALVEYRALAANNGALRAEALWGVAESAARLGEQGAESAALMQLLRDYPNSVYAPIARSRMADVTP